MGNFIGNVRMLPDYPKDFRIVVHKITGIVLGDEYEKVRKKGLLSDHDRATMKFLLAAIDFLPLAKEDGTDFTNAAFIFAQAGREFVVTAGKGDWEYYFSEDALDNIVGRCVRRPWLQYICYKVTSSFERIKGTLLAIVPLVSVVKGRISAKED